MSLEAAFSQARHVFVARIVDVRFNDGWLTEHDRQSDAIPQIARFSVIESFKGSPSSLHQLRAGYGYGDCGVPLIAGLDYLVLTDDGGELRYCNGFFGPYFLWDRERTIRDTDRKLAEFAESIRNHFVHGGKISDPPSAALGIEDSRSRWFAPEQ
ncbi:MAG: hypothetical protein ABI411_13000 [Tahibacter sp.]